MGGHDLVSPWCKELSGPEIDPLALRISELDLGGH